MPVGRQPTPLRKSRARQTPLACLLGACLLGAGVLSAPFAPVQAASSTQKELDSVERKIQSQRAESAKQKARAAKLKAEMSAVTKDLIKAAARVQEQETHVAGLEFELLRLQRIATAKSQKLRERRKQFAGVVMALTRIARFPTEALMAQPMPPEDTVRSAILLRAAVPMIEVRAQNLQDELQDLAYSRALAEESRAEFQGAIDLLRAEEGRIEAIRKKKAALRAEAISKSRAAQSKAQKLAREAKSIRDLMDRLEVERKKAVALARANAKTASKLYVQPGAGAQRTAQDIAALGSIGSISKARGRLPYPVVGKIVGLYGQSIDGQTSKGLSLETRSGGQVISPFDGEVVFGGPFRGYGQLLIIDHGEGYHSLLAGLGRIDAVIGQLVLAGEPVAIMTDGTNPGERAVLYVEFRRDNQPINPMPWLASRKGTPKG